MSRFTRWMAVVGGAIVLLWGPELRSTVLQSAQAAEADEQIPRYRLQVGQELIYRGGSDFKYEGGKFVYGESWKVWVVRQNPDKSWRLVIRHGSSFSQERGDTEKKKTVAAQPEKAEAPEDATFAWCDFYPDGRIVENDSFGFRMQPAKLLPRLPADKSEAKQGWTSRDTRMDETTSLRMLPGAAAGRCSIETVRNSPMNAIYGSEYRDVVTFDLKRGLPEQIASENSQTYGFNGKGTGSLELIEVKSNPADWTGRFADETERYFASQAAYEKATGRNDLARDDLKRALDEAAADLKRVGSGLQIDELKKLVDEQLAKQDGYAKYILEQAAERTAIVGTPSEDWTTTDLEGKTHALENYRGKVVVLDFWYRGCGWCIRAMPQMKEVAAHFEGQPVVVFGMNTDRKDEDATFVVEKMGLNYANLKATGLPEKYKVHGFPTLIILDQKGIIRDVHVGYSPKLKEEVVKSVEKLLTSEQ